jgi:hypothetical protein
MYYTSEDLEYLRGEKFSNGRSFQVAKFRSKNIARLQILSQLATDKNIIHLGFTDHPPLIKGKIQRNQWLHKILIEKSNLCVGIDIDSDAVEFVKNELGVSNVFVNDVLKDSPPSIIEKHKWDYMIIGEVLEHIDNPVSFLTEIRKTYGKYVSSLIITVPNAFDLINLPLLFKGRELINTDHRFWFTPYTLAKVVTQSGYRIESHNLSQTYMPKNILKRLIINNFPLTRETIILIAHFD